MKNFKKYILSILIFVLAILWIYSLLWVMSCISTFDPEVYTIKNISIQNFSNKDITIDLLHKDWSTNKKIIGNSNNIFIKLDEREENNIIDFNIDNKYDYLELEKLLNAWGKNSNSINIDNIELKFNGLNVDSKESCFPLCYNEIFWEQNFEIEIY
jgi:hypothetical protein